MTADPRLDLLFKEYYDRLVFFSWQITKDKQQSEDIAQDAFIAYWQQRNEIVSHPVAIKNFLYRSVKNASLNVVRHTRVVGQFQNSHPGTEPAEEYILEAIISAEIIAEVNLAIESLPPHLIKLTRLSFLEGKKNHEVAEELEMSVNTVKKQKQRVLELLKMSLHPELIILLVTYGTFFTRE
ncbi:sigma-70 family RNA polymerase sigma factor [Pararcticibacter amylolyticus]|nr:sigma-70 family RNA polymerase sigma factor [Pararcticibacter amylolyticus]